MEQNLEEARCEAELSKRREQLLAQLEEVEDDN